MVEVEAMFTSFDGPLRDPLKELQSLKDANLEWVHSARDEDGVLWSLPQRRLDQALKLYRLDARTIAAERSFAALCDRHNAVAIAGNRLIASAVMRPPLPPPVEHLQHFSGLGWSQEDIDCVKALTDPTEGIRERMKSTLGRLLTTPELLQELKDLRNAWLAVPADARPPLPIRRRVWRSTVCSILKLGNADRLKFLDFESRFERLCEKWQVLGVSTWKLPDPCGPILTPGTSLTSTNAPAEQLPAPWHFPLQLDDGVGHLMVEEHRRQAREHGIDDHGSWQTYAAMGEICFWELVLKNRYVGQRVRGFASQLEFFMADFLSISKDRVRKLWSYVRARRKGSLTSLQHRR